MANHQKYTSIDDSSSVEDEKSRMLEEELQYGQSIIQSRKRWRDCVPIVISTLFALAVGVAIGTWMQTLAIDDIAFKHVSTPSPVGSNVDTSFHKVLFNGSFMQENIYRKDGSPEVDAAWEELGIDYRPGRISDKEAKLAGFRDDQVQINPKYGGGYPMNVEGLHHLHCLNLLRKALWYNYDYYHKQGKGAFVNADHIIKLHVTHCLDIIRQQLQCSVDTGVLGQVWWDPSAPKTFVDFNTVHRCKNYDAIREWAKERQLPEHPPEDFILMPKKGTVTLTGVP